MMRKLAFGFLMLASVWLAFYLSDGVALGEETSDVAEGTTSVMSVNRALNPLRSALAKKIRENLPSEIHGFVEARGGVRLKDNKTISRTATIGESRLQLETSWSLLGAQAKLKSDFYYDAVQEMAKGDLREANIAFSPLEFLDLKIGRQTLTWGTGDMLFINDLFPKDWHSFFLGRDDEYLKAPSDAIKAIFFLNYFDLDAVYTPQFDPDRYITGRRISYWSDALGRSAGEDDHLDAALPDRWFRDDEIALRLYKNISGWEPALYYYNGYWKSPGGMNPYTGSATFPRLSVYGASLRGNVLKGIGNIEAGYYESKDDRRGKDPMIRNSEIRLLVGYEQEIAKDLTGAIQYYVEYMADYDDYRRTLPEGIHAKDEDRHVVTLRLTKLMMNQNLRLSLFAYYSPTDADVYIRPKVRYKFSDRWEGEIGGNIFIGKEEHTFFGQFEENSNIYASVRFNF